MDIAAIMNTTNIKIDETLDVMGLTCPKPLLYTKKKLATMQSQSILEILLNDKKSLEDFSFFCNATGHTLFNIIQDESVNNIKIYIKVR